MTPGGRFVLPVAGIIAVALAAVLAARGWGTLGAAAEHDARHDARGGASHALVPVAPPLVVPADRARRGCPAVAGVVDTACSVVRFDSLGAADGSAWSYGLYRHGAGAVELLLFARAEGRGPLVAAWRDRVRAGDASPRPALASHGGAALLGVRYCDGADACHQDFVLRRRGRWHPVAASFEQAVLRRFGGAPRGGFELDVRTLRGRVTLAAVGDACCSRDVTFLAALRGDRLELFRVLSVAATGGTAAMATAASRRPAPE